MRYSLDTNACILIIADASVPLIARVESCEDGDVVISAIVAAELVRGLSRLTPEGQGAVQNFLQTFPILPFDESAARAFPDVLFRRAKFDRLIAAHALAMNLVLVTANPNDFRDVSGLQVEDWTR